jgi:Leucine-rich repeat (LRR) protein
MCRVSNNDTATLDCSNLKLTSIPNEIPNRRILALNMSYNNLQHLDDDAFAECCGNLEELDLSSTQMSNLNRNLFKNLHNVRRLLLRNNSITKFDPETFVDLKNLELLDLSGNPLELQDAFIKNSNLEELNLDNCGIVDLPEKAFAGVSQLKNLTLRGNSLDSRFDITAFDDLESLTKLQIQNISTFLVAELCNKLTGIDDINFDGYNVSCLLLVVQNASLEEAIVPNDAVVDQPFELPILSAPPTTTTTSTTTTTTEIPLIKPPDTTLPAISVNVTQNRASDHMSSNITNHDEVDHAKVDIDAETLNYILVGESRMHCSKRLHKA